MNYGVASIAILAAAFVIVDVAGMPTTPTVTVTETTQKINTTTPKLTLPNEWLRLAVRNESIIYVTIGSSLELVCEGTASPPPTIKWFKEQTLVSPEAGYLEGNDIGNVPLGRLTSRLRFNCITPSDQGSYYCSARTGSKVRSTSPVVIVVVAGNDSDTSKLPQLPKVAGTSCEPAAFTPPRILVWGPTLLEFIGEDAILPCIAVGNPTPKTYWVDHDGNPISTELNSPRFKRLSNGELSISHIVWPDMGLYTCIAENEYGTDRAETFLYPAKKTDDDEE